MLRSLLNLLPRWAKELAVGLLLFATLFAVDQVVRGPGARARQSAATERVRRLPLPPKLVEIGFSSGFKTVNGYAIREIYSETQPLQFCELYVNAAKNTGGVLVTRCAEQSEHKAMGQFCVGDSLGEVYDKEQRGVGRVYLVAMGWGPSSKKCVSE